MKVGELKSIHSWVRSAKVSELLFVSCLVLPFYVLVYDYALEQINGGWKNRGLAIALIAYMTGIIWMKVAQSRDETDLSDLTSIRNYILDKGFKFMSFGKILEVNPKYTEERVRELIIKFPNDLRLARLKGSKRGIKVINIEEE